MNNIEMKKRPCGSVMSLCGYIYLFFMLLLLLMNSLHGSSAEGRVQAFEQGLHEQGEMDVSRLFDYGQESLALADRMALYGVPGLSITVIDDAIVDWSRTWGVRDNKSGTPVLAGTRFEAASASKLVTAVMVMKLVENGLLDLDEPVNARLERWQVPGNEFTAGSAVTLRQLLSHTSGMNRPESMYFFEENTSPTLLDVLNGESPAINDPATIGFVPGSKHRYSNIAYNVIQLLIEDSTGKPFPVVMQEYIFAPLGMESCSYDFPFSAEGKARTAFPHDSDGIPHMNDLHPAALAHGGLLCSSQDLAKLTVELIRSWQGKSDSLLSQDSMVRMMEHQHAVEDAVGGFNGQGLGLFMIGDGQNEYFAHHGYNTPGTASLVFANPASGDGAVIMANSAGSFALVFEILAGLADLYSWPVVRPELASSASSP